MNNEQEDYNNKKIEVLSKFRKQFSEGYYNYDPNFHSIVEHLIRDVNPYIIIEELILDRNKIIGDL